MTFEQCSGSRCGSSDFFYVCKSEAENRLRDFLSQLVEGVRSEEALFRATCGPRVAWNPYRPARGEHIRQGVLNSEIYEWRSRVPEDSLALVGNPLVMKESFNHSLATGCQRTGGLERVTEICESLVCEPSETNVEARTKAHTSLTSFEDDGVTREFTISDSCPVIYNEDVLRRVVAGVFDVLWRTVAVPWINEQYDGQSSPFHEKAPVAQHTAPFTPVRARNEEHSKHILQGGQELQPQHPRRWQHRQITSDTTRKPPPPQQGLTIVPGVTPLRGLPALSVQRDVHSVSPGDYRRAVTHLEVHTGERHDQLGLAGKSDAYLAKDPGGTKQHRGSSCVLKLRREDSKGKIEMVHPASGNPVCPKQSPSSRQLSPQDIRYSFDDITSAQRLTSRLTQTLCGDRVGTGVRGDISSRLGRCHRLAPVLIGVKQPPQPNHFPSPRRLQRQP
ncbi:hypothetical protein, conserved [Trypanosoma brucei brucei TREU927]|uniref:Uncharacterized protein n=1 Tax=Trypanosoma brucei brucei (strain 927/4 GUTat10.1) TaxID=185431 RepID=Q38AA4_TRYB2|nr:hypothetical protein, conserved [Trypanosoma brucei brucei TREU927]EAN78266.1 hypothetical protein, conserved [Trypanosoma brucei brucei TREU927]